VRRWSVPFPFVHSNVVAFSYNFGWKYNFFFSTRARVYLALIPFHCFHTYRRQCGAAFTGTLGIWKRKNLTANIYANANSSPLRSAAPVKTNNMADTKSNKHIMIQQECWKNVVCKLETHCGGQHDLSRDIARVRF
jgi:hypothetical protein